MNWLLSARGEMMIACGLLGIAAGMLGTHVRMSDFEAFIFGFLVFLGFSGIADYLGKTRRGNE